MMKRTIDIGKNGMLYVTPWHEGQEKILIHYWPALVLGIVLGIALSLTIVSLTEAQQCMQMGSMFSCSDGTQGMRFGNQSQWSGPGGRMGQSMDLGSGMGSFHETSPSGTRQGTYQSFGAQGLWSDNQGGSGQWMDLGGGMRSFSGSPGAGGLGHAFGQPFGQPFGRPGGGQ